MSMSVEAYQALTQGNAAQQNANSNSFDSLMKAREDERRYLMDRLAQQRAYGETGNQEMNQLNNGSGAIGFVKNLFGYGNKNADTETRNGFQKIVPNPSGAPESVAEKLIERMRGSNTADLAKSKIANDKGGSVYGEGGVTDMTTNQYSADDVKNMSNKDRAGYKAGTTEAMTPEQKKFMIADTEYRSKTGQPLTVEKYREMTNDTEIYNSGSESELVSRGGPGSNNPERWEKKNFNNVVSTTDNSAYRDSLDNQLKDMQAIEGDQKATNDQNAKIEKLNMEQATKIKNDQKALQSTSKNHPMKVLENAGVQPPADGEWKGTFAEQSNHVEQVYGALIDDAVKRQDWAAANKYEREMNANNTAVYKKFGEKYQPTKMFDRPKAGGGFGSGNLKEYPITATFKDANGNIQTTTRNIVMPEDVAANIATAEGRKYLKDKNLLKGEYATGDVYIESGTGKTTSGKSTADQTAYMALLAKKKEEDTMVAMGKLTEGERTIKYDTKTRNLTDVLNNSTVAYSGTLKQQNKASMEEE